MSTEPREALKTIIFWIFMLIFGIVIVNLSRGAVDLYKASDRVEDAYEAVAQLEQQKSELEDEILWMKSDAFVEQEIRNELHLAREDDIVVMVDEDLYESVGEIEDIDRGEEIEPNWKKWINIFW